jgi:PPOX class probable F420-dependent enzyme
MAYTVRDAQAPTLPELPFQALGGYPGFTPAGMERFLGERRVAVLAYLRADGRPHQAPIWFTYRDGVVHMTTPGGSPKEKALRRDPRVSLTVQYERAPYRSVIIEGTVKLQPLASPGDPASDPTAGMSTRYFGRLGAREYDKLTAEEYATRGLTLMTLQPTAVRGNDNRSVLSLATRAYVAVRERLPVPMGWV